MGLFVNRTEGVGAGLDLADPNSPLARYYLRAGDVLAAILIAGVFVLLGYAPLNHTDIWAHVKYGEEMIRQRQWLVSEPFSPFTEADPIGMGNAWLCQVLFAGVYRAGAAIGADEVQRLANGADALRLLHALLVAARLTLLYLAYRRLTRSAGLAAISLLFVLVISVGNLAVARPQVVAELLLAGMLWALTTSVLTSLGIAALVGILVLWANAHGSYPLGFLLLGAVTAGRGLQVAAESKSLVALGSDAGFRRLAAACVLGLLAVAVANPAGPTIFANTLAMAKHPVVRAMDEWQPIYSSIAGWARGLYLICAAIVFVGTALSPRGSVMPRWLPAALFLGLPLLNQRAVIWLISATPWLVLPGLAAALKRWRPNGWGRVPSFRKSLAALAVVVVAAMWSAPIQRFIDGKPGNLDRILSGGTPWRQALAVRDPALMPETRLAKVLSATYPDRRFAGCIFSSETLGDLFVFEDSPPYPVYIFTHVHLFNEDHWQRVLAIRFAAPGWRDVAAAARINLICVEAETERHQNLCKALRADPEWVVVTDEAGDKTKIDPRNRLFAALRKVPK